MKKFQLLILAMAFAGLANATVYYVSPAGDNSDGLSWSGAFQSIRAAVNAATSGDEVWVAQGTYVIGVSTDQLIYKSGVNVYGGFVGTETTLSQRSSDPALTIVKHGETVETAFRLLNNTTNLAEPALYDGFTFDGNNVSLGVRLAGNATLNNAVVKNSMVFNGSGAGVFMSSGADIPVTLSNTQVTNNLLKVNNENSAQLGGAGVYIANGANAALIDNCEISNNTIEGLSSTGNIIAMGAGIYLIEGTIRNTVIDGNKLINSVNASYNNNLFSGGAICIVPQLRTVAAKSVLIEGCTITNNESPSRGGAIIIDPRWSGQFQGNYTIRKSVISNNRSTLAVGGGLLSTAASAQTDGGWALNIENTVMANNSSMNGGGAIFLNVGGTFNVTNSTIVNNWTSNFGGGGIFYQGPANHTYVSSIKNTLLWGNVSPNRAAGEVQLKANDQNINIENSAYQAYDPLFSQLQNATIANTFALNTENDHATGPGFVAPSAGFGYDASKVALSANWQLTSGSVAVDAGLNLLADDLLGVARPQGAASDLGAYEYSPGISTATTLVPGDSVKLYISNGNLMVENVAEAIAVKVYSLMGVEIASMIAAEGTNSLALPYRGIFLVKAGAITQKMQW